MADVSSATKFFPVAKEGFTTTTSGTVSSGATTVGLNSVSGYSNGDTVVMVIDPTDATKKQAFTGVINTGSSQVTSVVWTEGTNQDHSAGATVVDYETATHWSLYSKGLLVEHAQAGTHTNITGTAANFTGAVSADTISEHTAANGVTVDGLNIKDGALNTNNSVVTSNITAAAVTAAKLQYGIVRNRQGGTTGDASWATQGTSDTATSAKGVYIQVGSINSSAASDVTVTFPSAYAYAPVVLVTPTTAATNSFGMALSASTTTFALRSINRTDGSRTAETYNWIAIGQ